MTDFVRGEVEGSGLYAHKKYKFNKSILDMIERETGKRPDLLNHQIEQVLQKVYSGEYTSLIKELTETDKKKLMVNMKDASPTSAISYKDDEEMYKKKFESISNFLKENFTQEEVDEYIEHCLTEFYKPYELHNGTQFYNTDILNFLDTIGIDMVMGFVIIKDYMNHAINIFDDVTEESPYVEETLMSEVSLDDKFDKFRKYVSVTEFVMSYENNDVFVVATDDLDTFENMKSIIDLKDDLIPRDYFQWGEDERNDDETMREKLNQAVKDAQEASENNKVDLKAFAENFESLSDSEKVAAIRGLSPEQIIELNEMVNGTEELKESDQVIKVNVSTEADDTTFEEVKETKKSPIERLQDIMKDTPVFEKPDDYVEPKIDTSGIDRLKKIMSGESVSEVEPQTPSNDKIPPVAKFEVLHENKKAEDVLMHGFSYDGTITLMDDFSSVDILDNNVKLSDELIYNSSFDNVGGFTVGGLHKYGDIDTAISESGETIEETQGWVNSLVIRDFVGTIEMYIEVKDEDGKMHYFDPSELADDDIYYDENIQEKHGEDADINVIININGTYSKIELLTSDIYNNL